jgi:hypothetical protein
MIRKAWFRVISSFISADYETLNAYADKADWAGDKELIYGGFLRGTSSCSPSPHQKHYSIQKGCCI